MAMMLCELPKYLRRDLRKLYGDLEEPRIWPLTMDAMIATIQGSLERGRTPVLGAYQWRTSSQFGARQTIAAVEGRLPVSGHYLRRGDFLIFTPRPT